MELKTLNMINFMLFIPCIFLQLIYWPTNTLHTTHLITSINLLHVSAPGFFSILHRPTPHTSQTSSGGDLFRSQRSRQMCGILCGRYGTTTVSHTLLPRGCSHRCLYTTYELIIGKVIT